MEIDTIIRRLITFIIKSKPNPPCNPKLITGKPMLSSILLLSMPKAKFEPPTSIRRGGGVFSNKACLSMIAAIKSDFSSEK